MPSDLYFIEDDGVVSDTGKIIERIKTSKVGYLNNSIAAPTVTYPVYERDADTITVFPINSVSTIALAYIKQPADPKWTYTVVNGDPLFNPSAVDYQDFELHPAEFPTIVVEMLTYFGINLREGEVIQIAEQLKNTIMQKDNS